MKFILNFVVVCCVAFLAASQSHAQGAMPESAQAWMDALATVDVVEFKESDVKRLLKTAKALESAGLDEIIANDSPPDALETIGNNAQAMKILKANGYSADGFSTHIMNLAMAMGASEMQKNKAQMDAAVAQLEAMKGQIPDEQYEFFRKQVLGVTEIFKRAPAGNIELAAKYQDEFEAIGNN